MAMLLNNQTVELTGGRYAIKTSGALDLQWQIKDEGFSTLTDGSFSGAADVIADLPECKVKIINASSNEMQINKVRL